MSSFRVRGGAKLKGEIVPQGAKNEALQIISAVLLTQEPVHIKKIPNIRDVNLLIELLADFGVQIEKTGEESVRFSAKDVEFRFSRIRRF